MLSRRHVRIKAMQILYGVYAGAGEEEVHVENVQKLLNRNIDKLYELYLHLLTMLVEFGTYVEEYHEELRNRYVPSQDELQNSLLLAHNPVLKALTDDPQFLAALKKYNVAWDGDKDTLRRILLDLKNQDSFKDYVANVGTSSYLHVEVLNFILKHYTTHMASVTSHFEENFYNWQDDRKVALNMASKTLQNIAAQNPEVDTLVPISDNPEDTLEYAGELIALTLEHDEELTKIVRERTPQWEDAQIASVDLILLKMAVCEFKYFLSIPATVTINEYIELAKTYSTPQSKKFVNGVLDAIARDLRKDLTQKIK